ncbi:MAG: PrgI family protein [bacterium]|nr:PrgI family protein [bacterium]
MPTFQVPQFIDIEDKIIGPLTLKQFLFLVSAGIIIFILYSILQFWLWIIVSIIVAGAGMGFAFVKINGQSLSKVALNGFKYLIRPRLYVWQRGQAKKSIAPKPVVPKKEPIKEKKRLSQEELEELAKKLDE